jgi:uncharacterized protein YjcR
VDLDFEKKHKVKLNENSVASIREDYKNGLTCKMLAEKYNVSKYTIKDVITRRTWNKVK